MWIYLQDRFVPKEAAKVSVFDHGFLYGDGLFETLRAYDGVIFRLRRHLERLAQSARRLELSLPPLPELETILYDTLNRNALRDALLRLTLTRGEGETGLDPALCAKPTLVVTARPFTGYPPGDYLKGISAAIVQVRRCAPATLDPAMKSTSFLNNIIAKLEAKKQGAFEGLFLNMEGYLCEGTISNLFWVRGGKLETPSPEAGLLEGITREVVIALARKKGLSVEEGFYKPDMLMEAEEAFLTNSGFELMPLTRVNGESIGRDHPGPITGRLHEAFKEAVKER
ncbi:MAG: branched-chain amino acid aminotransferase [Candidatus Manganitrophaceae bacterium]|nr:MAG: branched-chain amino acid aminotransferase [Candidatus Manganitrophaceae bacterium]